MAGKEKEEVPSTDIMKIPPGVQMNPEVWGHLSHELLPLVLIRLPWWSNLQLRCVCKNWNTMLCNRTLLSKLPPIQPPTSFCCILKNCKEYKIVHSSVRKWQTLPRSQILPKDIASDSHFEVTAATSGILLISRLHAGLDRFLVNPLNGTQRQLPPLPKLEDDAKELSPYFTLRMTADDHNVKLVLVQYLISDHVPRICVFDLLRDSWDVVFTNLRTKRILRIVSVVMVGNDMFLLTKHLRNTMHRVFNVSETSLIEIPVEQTTIDGRTVHLFQHRGSLMIVRGTNVNPPIVDIWRLDQVSRKWEKVASMPNKLLSLLYSTSRIGLFNFDVEGDYICLSNGRLLKCIVVYNIVEQLWGHISYEEAGEDASCMIFPSVHIWQPRLDVFL